MKNTKVIFYDTEECPKFEGKLTLGSKNDMGNLVNFNVTSDKSENLHFDVLLFSIAYKVSAKKYRRIISHDTEKRHEKIGEL